MAASTTSTRYSERQVDINRKPGAMVTRRRAVERNPRRPKVGQDLWREIGTSGLRQYGGFVFEEWLRELQGRQGAWAYREMSDNDPVIGSILLAIEKLANQVEYRVEDGTPEANDLIHSCMHDMEHTWGDFMSEAFSFLPYGWSLAEEVYKRRDGQHFYVPPLGDSSENRGAYTQEATNFTPSSSQYKDGRIGWRKLSFRGQETMLRWEFAGYSWPIAMEQLDWHGGKHIVPMAKSLLFRTRTAKNNPEGRSILRNAWTSWYMVQNLRQIEAIGYERGLAGIPVAKPPPGVDLFAEGMEGYLERVTELVTSIRRDEDEGIVLPSADWELELLTTGHGSQFDPDTAIRRYEQRIASSALADFILIGQDAVGSFAMVDIKSDLFGVVVDAFIDRILEEVNRTGIPRLLRLNGMPTDDLPRIEHSSAGRLDLEKVGEFLYHLAMANAPIPWSEQLMEQLFGEAGLPVTFGEDEQVTAVEKGEKEEHARLREVEERTAEAPPSELPTGTAPMIVTSAGTVIMLTPALAARAALLSAQLAKEIAALLGTLGAATASAYLAVAGTKVLRTKRQREALAKRVLGKLDLDRWFTEHLQPLLNNHAARVAGDTARTVGQQMGRKAQFPPSEVTPLRRVLKRGGTSQPGAAGLKLSPDLEPQVKAAILKAIEEGLDAGDSPIKTAARIRHLVPAGRFVHAGPKYRAELIARDVTAELQRQASVILYQGMGDVIALRLRDGVYGPPRSDAECIVRDGTEVPIAEANTVKPRHPLCTLGFEPVVSNVQPTPEQLPIAA